MYRQWREWQYTAIGICEHLVSGAAEPQQCDILVEDDLAGRLVTLLRIIGNSPPILVPYCYILLILDAEIIVTEPVAHAKDYGTDHHYRYSHTCHFFRDCSLATENQ